jgi:hypothetical protein
MDEAGGVAADGHETGERVASATPSSTVRKTRGYSPTVALLVAVPISAAIYVLLNLTSDKQYALFVALFVFVITYITPLVQTYYARKRTEFAGRMDRRDAARYERELAEANKKPQIRASFLNGNVLEFFPVGGHRRLNSAVQFGVFAENFGDAQASDVIVSLGMPAFAHQVILPEQHVQAITEDGRHVSLAVERDTDAQIRFKPNTLPYQLAYEVATVELKRPLYPKQPKTLGTVAVMVGEGVHRFPWVVESSGGTFKSDSETELVIVVHDTAEGHEPIKPSDDPMESCLTCRAQARLHSWASQVELQLNKRRAASRKQNPSGIPLMTMSPGGVQWYQEWTGPHRWVTCELIASSDDVIRAYFWSEGAWEQRKTQIVRMDEPTGFAAEIWNYLRPTNGPD